MKDTKEEMLVLQGAIRQSSISSLTVLFYPPYLPMSLLSLLQSPVSHCAGTVSISGHPCGIYGGQSEGITDFSLSTLILSCQYDSTNARYSSFINSNTIYAKLQQLRTMLKKKKTLSPSSLSLYENVIILDRHALYYRKRVLHD